MPLCHVRYELLVAEPEHELERVFAFLGLPNEPEAVDYGERFEGSKAGPGDPIGVSKHSRPTTSSLHKWADEVAADTQKRDLADRMIAMLTDEELSTWGTPRDAVWEPLAHAGGAPPPRRSVSSYTLQRRVLMALRKDIHERPHGKLVERIRYYCDVLLRDTL